jgi:sialate O-acetylesterase
MNTIKKLFRACLKRTIETWCGRFGAPPLGGFGAAPPKGGTPIRIFKQPLRFVPALLTLGFGLPVLAEVSLSHMFGDNMVLQRDMPVKVWGTADPGETVEVRLDGDSTSVIADQAGNWMATLPARKEGMDLQLVARGGNPAKEGRKNTVTFTNVVMGEVWVCAGQSNMEKPIGIHPGQNPCLNYQQEIAAADYPEIRLMEIPPAGSGAPVKDVANLVGLVCTPQNICVKRGGGYGYSACAYFFGREIHRALKVPVGLIAAGASGERCEPFTPPAGSRFNAMIYPIIPFGIRGAIWYQGESNVADGMQYFENMKALIGGWRKAWQEGDFPFGFVQITPAKYYADAPEKVAFFWEAQTAMLAITNTGMAATHDIGSYPDCHAINKQAVGKRLALWAIARIYGHKDLVYSGPLYKRMTVEGGKIRIQFDFAGGGLVSSDGKPLTWFTIAGEDKQFVAATAVIDGDSVLVSSEVVAKPVAVHFAWSQAAAPNLANKEGLPASAFRTDGTL